MPQWSRADCAVKSENEPEKKTTTEKQWLTVSTKESTWHLLMLRIAGCEEKHMSDAALREEVSSVLQNILPNWENSLKPIYQPCYWR